MQYYTKNGLLLIIAGMVVGIFTQVAIIGAISADLYSESDIWLSGVDFLGIAQKVCNLCCGTICDRICYSVCDWSILCSNPNDNKEHQCIHKLISPIHHHWKLLLCTI